MFGSSSTYEHYIHTYQLQGGWADRIVIKVNLYLENLVMFVSAKNVAKYCTKIRKVQDNPPHPNYQSIIFRPRIIVLLMLLPIHPHCSIQVVKRPHKAIRPV